jgi:hypothetical protein
MTHYPDQPLDLFPALILFGTDHAERPHAGWFSADELVAAERASSPLGYAALRVTTADERDLALMLPRGRVVGQGQVLVPLLSPELFQVLRLLVVGVRLVQLRPFAREQSPDPERPPRRHAGS